MFFRLLRSPLPRHPTVWRRYKSSLPPLPPLSEWKNEFSTGGMNGRISLCNSETADRLAELFVAKVSASTSNGEGKIIIEAYPGPGVLTRSLLALPPNRLKRLIVLEDQPLFLDHLKVLEQHDPRLTVVPLPGLSWSAYSAVKSQGLLNDVKEVPWEEGETNLQFISHIPSTVVGDQIVAQFFRSIPERSWLFKYGRVQMSFILRRTLWERVCAAPSTMARCKVSVIAEAVSDYKEAVPHMALQPYGDHFYPPPASGFGSRDSRATGHPFAAVNVWPKADSAIRKGLLDKWDFVTRHLFVLKSTPLKKAIGSVAFGATNLLKPLQDPSLPENERVDVTKRIKDLTVHDWTLIIKAFDEWPFAPESLNITDSQFTDMERD